MPGLTPTERILVRSLRNVRLERGIKQGALAAQMGISPQLLSAMEHARRKPQGYVLSKWMRGLELDPNAGDGGIL